MTGLATDHHSGLLLFSIVLDLCKNNTMLLWSTSLKYVALKSKTIQKQRLGRFNVSPHYYRKWRYTKIMNQVTA